MNAIEKITGTMKRNRLQIKTFKTSLDMHTFLCKGDNACHWRESNKELKRGTYAFAGGQWQNVKNIDPSALAHF